MVIFLRFWSIKLSSSPMPPTQHSTQCCSEVNLHESNGTPPLYSTLLLVRGRLCAQPTRAPATPLALSHGVLVLPNKEPEGRAQRALLDGEKQTCAPAGERHRPHRRPARAAAPLPAPGGTGLNRSLSRRGGSPPQSGRPMRLEPRYHGNSRAPPLRGATQAAGQRKGAGGLRACAVREGRRRACCCAAAARWRRTGARRPPRR